MYSQSPKLIPFKSMTKLLEPRTGTWAYLLQRVSVPFAHRGNPGVVALSAGRSRCGELPRPHGEPALSRPWWVVLNGHDFCTVTSIISLDQVTLLLLVQKLHSFYLSAYFVFSSKQCSTYASLNQRPSQEQGS